MAPLALLLIRHWRHLPEFVCFDSRRVGMGIVAVVIAVADEVTTVAFFDPLVWHLFLIFAYLQSS